MKYTNGQIHGLVSAIVEISRRPRQIPQLAKYRLAKVHSAIEKVYAPIEAARLALVHQFGEEKFNDAAKTQSLGWGLYETDVNFPSYMAAWNALEATVCEVDLEVPTITLAMFGNETKGGIEVNEWKQLEPILVDNTDPPRVDNALTTPTS